MSRSSLVITSIDIAICIVGHTDSSLSIINSSLLVQQAIREIEATSFDKKRDTKDLLQAFVGHLERIVAVESKG